MWKEQLLQMCHSASIVPSQASKLLALCAMNTFTSAGFKTDLKRRMWHFNA